MTQKRKAIHQMAQLHMLPLSHATILAALRHALSHFFGQASKRVIVSHHDPNPTVRGKGIQVLQDAGIEVETGSVGDRFSDTNAGILALV
jgi:pyrimidine deaminase RibD-like protein